MGRTFQRARRPEQKAQQRARILAAARAFLEQAEHSTELSLADVANLAGMARSNVYRYFDSREAILLGILATEIQAWVDDVVEGLACAEGGVHDRIEHLADTLESATEPRPLLCHLVSVVPSLLDTAQPSESASPFAEAMQQCKTTLTDAMGQAVPELGEDHHEDLLRHVTSFVIGAWPLSATASDSGPGLHQRRKPRFLAELRRAIVLVARGILGDAGLA